MLKTSATDPLLIDAVTVPGTEGVIGMTLCPGRKGTSLAGGRWDRDLDTDLGAIRAWRPNLVIALLEDHEYAGLGIPGFRTTVERSGIPWRFLPIPDGGTPDANALERWRDLGPYARNLIRSGGRILVHCRAGLGRTGMLVAALLVEFGATPDEAIKAVRQARPNTIETAEQERFVRSQQPIATTTTPDRTSRVRGTMAGAAIGDALGAAFEFLDSRTIENALGEPFAWNYTKPLPGSLLANHEPGFPTDDTAMALSVAHVVASNDPPTPGTFARAFLTDLDRTNGRYATMFWNGGPGGATTRALARLSAGADPASCGRREDGGNGAAMRAHPVGTIAHRQTVLDVARAQAIVTHGHPAAIAAAQAVAALVHDALAGDEPMLEPPPGIHDDTFLETWRELHRGTTRGASELPNHLRDVAMSGWATVAAAHAISYVFQDDPQRAIAAAAASGGDTDTVASIAGAIVGARTGVGPLEHWLANLRAREDVRRAADLLLAKLPSHND